MKNPIAATAALLILSVGTAALAGEQTYRVVVSLKDSGESNPATRRDEIAAAQRRVSQLLDGGRGHVSQFYSTIPAFAASVTQEGWVALSASSSVTRVDLDEAAEVTMSRAGSVARSLEVQRMGLTGKGVTVAVIDSGIDSSHRDLAGAIADEACFCMNAKGEPCCPNGTTRQGGLGSAWDDNGHGTHIAGIIAGRGRTAPRGLAPEAYLVVVKIADKDGSTSTWSMLAALDWLATSHPEVQVVNMSLGTTTTYAGSCDSASSITSSLAAAGRVLGNRGTIIVAAAGNSGLTDEMTAPACVTGFLSVGAVYGRGDRAAGASGCAAVKTKADGVTCFSNSSSALALLAPGAGILSTNRGGGTAIGSGTSQAAGVVSGAVALLMEGAPVPNRIGMALRGSGVSVTDSRNGRATPRIDVRAARTALSGR